MSPPVNKTDMNRTRALDAPIETNTPPSRRTLHGLEGL